MFEKTSELATDLEWLLQSGQATEELLLEALIEEFYQPVYHVSLALLDDQNSAQKATILTLADVLTERHSYRDHIGVRAWVLGFTIDACYAILDGIQLQQTIQNKILPTDVVSGVSKPDAEHRIDAAIGRALDEFNRQTRSVVILTYLAGFDVNEIGTTLKMEPTQVTLRLEAARTALEASLKNSAQESLGMMNNEILKGLDQVIHDSLLRRWPTPQISQQNTKKQSKQIARLAGKSSARKRGLSHIKEIAVISVIILAFAGLLWGSNNLWPGPAEETNSQATKLVTKLVYVTKIVGRTATPTPSSTSLPPDAFYIVRPGDTIDSVAVELDVSIQALLDLNRIPADASLYEDQPLLIPDRVNITPPAATPVPAARHVRRLQAPYTSMEILQRLKLGDDLFNTLWFDAVMIDNGPASYIGPARTRRVQAWLSMDQVLIIVGKPDDQIEEVWLMLGDDIYTAYPSRNQNEFILSEPATALGNSELPEGLEQLFLTVLGNDPWRFSADEEHLIAIDRSEWAGQSVLVVDEFNSANGNRQARLWVDDRTGLVLHKQWYAVEDPSISTQDISLVSIAYDVDFPQELFDPRLPWRGGFAVDHSGQPANLNTPAIVIPYQDKRIPGDRKQAPVGYNPAQGTLTFVYPPDFLVKNLAPIDLFADGYLLGEIMFGNPWHMLCQRSPNGEWIAYVSLPSGVNFQPSLLDWLDYEALGLDSRLYWFNLLELPGALSTMEAPMTQLDVTAFAWAPDSRRLAAFGFEPGSDTGMLYILDSETGSVNILMELNNANSLVWRPDGQRLALIARYYPNSFEEQLLIIDAEDGGIINFIPIDTQSGYSDDWPVEKWDTDFPVQMGGIQACAAPPTN